MECFYVQAWYIYLKRNNVAMTRRYNVYTIARTFNRSLIDVYIYLHPTSTR